MKHALLGLFGMTVVLAFGCQRTGVERVVLSGRLSYDGHPLEVGKILFVPDEESTASMTIADFKDGQYDTTLSDGVAVGNYRVEITAHRAVDVDGHRPGPFSNAAPQVLPAKYNTESELKLSVVSGQSRKVHNFELSK